MCSCNIQVFSGLLLKCVQCEASSLDRGRAARSVPHPCLFFSSCLASFTLRNPTRSSIHSPRVHKHALTHSNTLPLSLVKACCCLIYSICLSLSYILHLASFWVIILKASSLLMLLKIYHQMLKPIFQLSWSVVFIIFLTSHISRDSLQKPMFLVSWRIVKKNSLHTSSNISPTMRALLMFVACQSIKSEAMHGLQDVLLQTDQCHSNQHICAITAWCFIHTYYCSN